MKKLKAKLCEKDGAAMVESIAGFFIAILVVALILNVITALMYRSRLGTFADNVSKIVSVEGKYDSSVEAKIEEYKEESSLGAVTVSLEGTEFMPGSKKIQLDDQVKVTVKGKIDISFFTFANLRIDLQNKALSRSEVYWKS